MLRKLIETRTGPLTDPEFHEIITQVTLDIRVNHLGYNLRTSLPMQFSPLTEASYLRKTGINAGNKTSTVAYIVDTIVNPKTYPPLKPNQEGVMSQWTNLSHSKN